jgi:hypothetical protein
MNLLCVVAYSHVNLQIGAWPRSTSRFTELVMKHDLTIFTIDRWERTVLDKHFVLTMS